MKTYIKGSDIPVKFNKGILAIDTMHVIKELGKTGIDKGFVANIVYENLIDTDIQGLSVDEVNEYLEQKAELVNAAISHFAFIKKDEDMGYVFFNPRDYYNINDIHMAPNIYAHYSLPGALVSFRIVGVTESLIRHGIIVEDERSEFGRVIYNSLISDPRFFTATTLHSVTEFQQRIREIAAGYIDDYIKGRMVSTELEKRYDLPQSTNYIIVNNGIIELNIEKLSVLMFAYGFVARDGGDLAGIRSILLSIQEKVNSLYPPDFIEMIIESEDEFDRNQLLNEYNETLINIIYYNAKSGFFTTEEFDVNIQIPYRKSQVEIEKEYFDACLRIMDTDYISEVLINNFDIEYSDAYHPSLEIRDHVLETFNALRNTENDPYILFTSAMEIVASTVKHYTIK